MTTTLTPEARTQDRRGIATSSSAAFAGTWQIGIYFWIAVVIITAGLTIALDRWDGLDGSVADGVLGSMSGFLGVMGILVPLAMLPLHLAGGATRRSFTRGIVLASLGIGLTFGLVGAVGMLVESLVFDGFGWSSAVEGPGLYDTSGDFFAIWLSWSLSGAAYYLGGAALAVGYYRWGGVLGTVHLFLVLLLVIAGEVALGGGVYSAGVGAVLGDGPPAWVGVIVAVAALGGLVAVLHHALRDVPLNAAASAACR